MQPAAQRSFMWFKMASLFHIASYPRSGKTYVRALLANYLSGFDRPLTTQEIASFGTGEHGEAPLQQVYGPNWRNLSVEDRWRGRGTHLTAIRQAIRGKYGFLKTHTLNGYLFYLSESVWKITGEWFFVADCRPWRRGSWPRRRRGGPRSRARGAAIVSSSRRCARPPIGAAGPQSLSGERNAG